MRYRIWFVLAFVFLGVSVFFFSQSLKRTRELEKARTANMVLQHRLDGVFAQLQHDTYNIGQYNAANEKKSPNGLLPPMPVALQDELREYRLQQLFVPDVTPVAGDFAVSQRFSNKHPALDLAAPMDTKVIAAATGFVSAIYVDRYFGNVMVIDHLNGLTTFYAHLDDTFYRVGDLVKKGEPIALVGNTGHSSGAHLHFEIRDHGTAQDPEKYLSLTPEQNE